jgi:hypothetical protein
MRRLLLFVGLVLVTAVAAFPVIAGAAPSPNACNKGTEKAHMSMPEGVPGHDHVPHCHDD